MADVNCQVRMPESASGGESSPGLTVGQRFAFHCEGPWPTMDAATVELRLEEADKYKLKLLKFQSADPGAADLEVVSYVVGPHELKAVQLTDAQNSVVLGDLKFEVKSVQNPEEPVQEPFPPLGPMTFFPVLFAVVIAALIAALAGGVFIGMLRRRHRRKILNEVLDKVYQSTPAPEFYRELRALSREYLFMTDPKASTEGAPLTEILRAINRHFRVYLVRTYLVPAHRLPATKILKELQPVLGKDSFVLLRLGQVLRELDRALANETNVRGADLEQLSRLVREWVELANTKKPEVAS